MQIEICQKCNTMSEYITTCFYPDNSDTVKLCPLCLSKQEDFCMSCGLFSSGTEGFDIIHPGHCNECWEEIQEIDDWVEEGGDTHCPNCKGEYDEIDYEYQICHLCNHENKEI